MPDPAAGPSGVDRSWKNSSDATRSQVSARYGSRAGADLPDTVVERAAKLVMSGRPADAVGMLRPYVSSEPDDADAHQVLGWALSVGGSGEAALAELERARRLQPRDPLTLTLAALTYSSVGRHDEARSTATALVGMRPRESRAHQVLAEVEMRAGRPGAATRELAAAASIDPRGEAAERLRAIAVNALLQAHVAASLALAVTGRMRSLLEGNPDVWGRGAAVLGVLVTAATWWFQLRRGSRGAWRPVLTTLVRSPLTAAAAVGHLLTVLALLAVAVVPQAYPVLIVVAVVVVLATWVPLGVRIWQIRRARG